MKKIILSLIFCLFASISSAADVKFEWNFDSNKDHLVYSHNLYCEITSNDVSRNTLLLYSAKSGERSTFIKNVDSRCNRYFFITTYTNGYRIKSNTLNLVEYTPISLTTVTKIN